MKFFMTKPFAIFLLLGARLAENPGTEWASKLNCQYIGGVRKAQSYQG